MSSEIRRHNFQRRFRPHRLEHSHLGLQIESVAALGFNRCCSVFKETLSETDLKVSFVPHGFHTRQNSTATRKNFHVRIALNSPFELIRASAGENCVRVRIDKSWKNNLAACLERRAS